MDSNTQIKKGALIAYFGIIFNIVAGFVYTPWLVEQIGQADYGLYTLAMSVVSFFLLDFGISAAISRYISLYNAKNDKKKIEILLSTVYMLYLIIDSIIFIVLLFVFFFLDNMFLELTALELGKLKIIFIIVSTFSLISFPLMPLNGILISYEKFVALKLFDLSQKVFSIVFVVIGLILGYGLFGVVTTNALVTLVITALKFIYVKRKTNLTISFKNQDKMMITEIFNFSMWTTIISIAQRLIINISPTLIGIFVGAIQVSIFSIGVTLEAYVFTFASALNGFFLPKVTRLTIEKGKSTEKILELMIKIGRIQLMIISLIFIGLLVFGKEFIELWMGPNFKESYYVALFLITPSLVTLTQEIAYNYLIAMNEIKYRAYDFIGSAIISILLSIVLTPIYGAIGAALSAGIGIFFGHVVVMNIIYHKKFKINVLEFFKKCHLNLLFPILLTLLGSCFIQWIFSAGTLFLFVIKVVLTGLLHIITLWFLGLNTLEKSMVKKTIRKIKRK